MHYFNIDKNGYESRKVLKLGSRKSNPCHSVAKSGLRKVLSSVPQRLTALCRRLLHIGDLHDDATLVALECNAIVEVLAGSSGATVGRRRL
jgi:hypothetical protein